MQTSINSFRAIVTSALLTIVTLMAPGADFRSVASGDWHNPAVWQTDSGTGWIPATIPPYAFIGRIFIQSGHTIRITQPVQIDEIEVRGKLEIASAVPVTCGSAGRVMQIFTGGILWNQGDFAGDPQRVHFDDGATYIHAWTSAEGRIPLAAWSPASTVQITGYTTTAAATPAGNWSQFFGRFSWATPALATDFQLNGLLTDIRGDMIISNTRGNVLRLSDNTDAAVRIGGNLDIRDSARFSVSRTGPCKSRVMVSIGGDMLFSSAHPLGSRFCEQGTSVFQVTGSFLMTNGLLYFSSGSGGTSNSGADLRLQGDFSLLGGTIDASVAYSNRVGDLYFEGTNPQRFMRTGQVIGAFHYHIVSGSTVRIDDGHSFYGSSLEVGDTNGGATLVVGSTDPAGAIQKGQVGGNIQVRTQFWRSGSWAVYGGSERQYISSDHPSATGIHTRIQNVAGVEVSGAGSTVVCSGDLVVVLGDLTISRRYLTVRGRLSTPGGKVNVDADVFDVAVGLTVDGILAPAAGFPIAVRGSQEQNAGNAILTINGNLSGTGFVNFSGPNTQLAVGGVPRILDRPFPVDGNFQLESLTTDVSIGATVLSINQPLQLGNYSGTSGYTGGLYLRGGIIRMNAPLVVSTVCETTGGWLDFRGQSLELMRNIRVSPPAGGFMSDDRSVLRVTSAFGGIDNTIAFSSSANGLGILELNRTADVTTVGSIPITPHLRIIGPLRITRKLFLQDGEALHDGGLTMASGSEIIRTPHSAFADETPQPLAGGPYRLRYADGKIPLILRSGCEASGNISSLHMDVSDSVVLAGFAAVLDSLVLKRGVFSNPSNFLTIAQNGTVHRMSGASFIGSSPQGTGYALLYSGGKLITGVEATGRLLSLTNRSIDTVRVSSGLTVSGLILQASGIMDMATDSVLCGSLTARSAVLAPRWLRVNEAFELEAMFSSRGGTVEFAGESQIFGEPLLHNVLISGGLKLPPLFTLTGNLRVNGRLDSGTGAICTMGQLSQIFSGDSLLQLNDLRISGYQLLLQSPARVRGEIRIAEGSVFDAGADLLTLEAQDGINGARISALPPSAGIKGTVITERVYSPASGYRYIAPPLSGFSARSLVRDLWARKILAYNEPTPGQRNNGFYGWPMDKPLESGRGLAVLSSWSAGGSTLTWYSSGHIQLTASRGRVSLPVTRTWSGTGNQNEDGWNLVGNPYPSPVYWTADDSAWTMRNISRVVVVPKPTGRGYYAYDPVRRIGDLPDAAIGIGQAFWVYATVSVPELIVTEHAKNRPSESRHLGANSLLQSSHSQQGYLSLMLGGILSMHDTVVYHHAYLFTDAGASARHDNYDLTSLPHSGTPQLSLQSSDGSPLLWYATDVFPKNIPLQISGLDSMVLLSIDSINLPENYRLLLRDNKTGYSTSLVAHRWISIPVGSNDFGSRYELLFVSDSGDQMAVVEEGEVGIFPNPVQGTYFFVKAPEESHADVRVFDLFGRLLIRQFGLQAKDGLFRIECPKGYTGVALLDAVITDSNSKASKTIRKRVVFAD